MCFSFRHCTNVSVLLSVSGLKSSAIKNRIERLHLRHDSRDGQLTVGCCSKCAAIDTRAKETQSLYSILLSKLWQSIAKDTARNMVVRRTHPPTRRVAISAFLSLLLRLFLATPVSIAFQNLDIRRRSFRRENGLLVLLATKSPKPVDPAARFHVDMYRILESRRNLASSTSIALSPMERRKRPEILSTDIDGTERVMGMLLHMESISVATEESYKITLGALVHRGRLRWRRDDSTIVCAADEVTGIMHGIWGQSDLTVSTETCNMALQAYAVCATPRGNRQYAQHAQDLVEKMDENGIEVSADSLCHLIHAWAWQQENMQPGRCAEMAQENLDRLLEKSPSDETLLLGYHWLLEAWSKASDDGARERADEILKHMIAIQKRVPQAQYPNANTFSNAVLAWSKAPGQSSADRAQTLLDMVIETYDNGELPDGSEPELIAFNGILSAWGRIGRVDKAEKVLRDLKRLSEVCENLAPDVVSYNNVLHAYLRSKDKQHALDRILEIIAEMEESDAASPSITPDSFSYSLVLKAYVQSKRPEAALRAYEMLSKMRELWKEGDETAKPSNRHFNIAINAMAKSKTQLDPWKAYELLNQMQSSKKTQPDIISFTSVIECFSKSSDPQAADLSIDLLRQATAIYEETAREDVMPNLRTYSMVISAMATNPTYANVERARTLLIELVEKHEESDDPELQPNAFPFNYVLNCAANCLGSDEEKTKAFQLAAKTYNDLRKSSCASPDSFTYAFWFKCCNNLLPLGAIRTKGITLAFEQCKGDGILGQETLHRFLAGTPAELVSKLLDLEPSTSPSVFRRMTIDDLPPAWSRNVRK